MKKFWLLVGAAFLCLVPPERAAENDKKTKTPLKTYQIPYRLTDTSHVLVRAKINGEGPFNFIVDTGAPALFVSTSIGRKLGVKPNEEGWSTFDRLEIEGGAVIRQAKGRVEDPFQLEGMNGLGLAGAKLHGIIGYNILARYRLEFDFTRDKMAWTELDFDPPLPKSLGEKAGGAGGLDAMATLMKFLGAFLGKKAQPDIVTRGFLGMELAEDEDKIEVKAVFAKGPAAEAGIQAGDRISQFQGKAVASPKELVRLAEKLTAGEEVRITLLRGEEEKIIAFKTGEGL